MEASGDLGSGGLSVLDDGPEGNSCRPSIDVLFESLVRRAPAVIACLLTGMGRDGAAGLLALRAAGARTIAEDESTCTVLGMPHEAIRLGAAEAVLPSDAIARRIVALVAEARPGPERR